MKPVERALKRRWHDELVAHPTTHAWVLNLYRAGEHHPATVDDYFPVEHAPAGLAEKLAKHRAQEAKHVKLYERAVGELGCAVEDMTGLDVFNIAIRAHTDAAAGFRIGDDDSDDTKREKLAHFLAHAHFLESRIARSLEHHLDACERAGVAGAVAAVVGAVLDDERDHASYTLAAARELLTRERAGDVIELHRRAEARANLAFSARQVRSHLARHRAIARGEQQPAALWRFCAFVMDGAVDHV